MKNVLITGSSGMIGTRLFEKMVVAGYSVTGLDKKNNIWHKEIDKCTIKHDLRFKIVKKITKPDIIIHLAANARVHDLVVSPDLALENILSTFNILEYARLNNVKKIIFSSSREVYGNTKKIIHSEDDVKIKDCLSPYTSSKLSAESLIYSYNNCYNLDYVILRFSNVYGMYDNSDRLMPLFIKNCMRNKDITVFGGNKVLDFTYIDDTVDGVMKVVKNFNKSKGQVFNIASGHGIKILDVANMIRNAVGSKNNVVIKENRSGEVIKFVADVSKSKKFFGYQSKVDIESGLLKTIDWYSSHNKLSIKKHSNIEYFFNLLNKGLVRKAR